MNQKDTLVILNGYRKLNRFNVGIGIKIKYSKEYLN